MISGWRSNIRTCHGRGSLLHWSTHHLRKMVRVESATVLRRLQHDEMIEDRSATAASSSSIVADSGVSACVFGFECGSDTFSRITPLGEPVFECEIFGVHIPERTATKVTLERRICEGLVANPVEL